MSELERLMDELEAANIPLDEFVALDPAAQDEALQRVAVAHRAVREACLGSILNAMRRPDALSPPGSAEC